MESGSNITRPGLMAGGAVALLAGLLLWCGQTPALPVAAVHAKRGALRVEVNTNGTVEVVPDAELRVHAGLDGRIVEILDPGTKATRGQVLLRVDDEDASSRLAAAEVDRLSAQESLQAARRKLERIRKKAATDDDLFDRGALTPQRQAESHAALREARARLETLEREVPLRVTSLEHRIAELRGRVAAARLTAPFDGTVYRTGFRQGEMVRMGDPILWLADLSKLRVRANVDQVDLGRVRPGQTVRVSSNAYPERSWAARVTEIVPRVMVKENRSVAEAFASLSPPAEGLVPGMTVDVDIVVDEAPNALQVPPAAVHAADGKSYVFRVAGGRAARTPVVLGRSSVRAIEIVGGLEEGDPIIVTTPDGLHDGRRVEAKLPDVAAP